MKIKLLVVGKTDQSYLQEGVSIYEQRLKHYIGFELITIPDLKKVKNLSEEQQKEKEGELILKQLSASDHLILLDEGGKTFDSIGFSGFIQQKANMGLKNLVFVVGGPYGFSKAVYQQANGKLSLSCMTFSHQMVRLFFTEQLYRAMTILKGEPYHHR
jgi:23S rRNA (pseudouridine1915-N3)-methyltransferase